MKVVTGYYTFSFDSSLKKSYVVVKQEVSDEANEFITLCDMFMLLKNEFPNISGRYSEYDWAKKDIANEYNYKLLTVFNVVNNRLVHKPNYLSNLF